MKKILIIVIVLFTTTIIPKNTNANKAEVLINLGTTGEAGDYNTAIQTSDVAIATYVGNIISYILGFLGVIFLVLLIYSGFLWMTARGESDAVSTSKDILTNAIIGLMIVLMSYGVTFYVVSKLSSTTTTGSGFTTP